MPDKEPEQERVSQRTASRPTMVDVAKLAGVSQATVSLVLNQVGGSRVNAETQKLVRDAAKTLGYRIWRRSPVGGGSIQTIGYLIEDTVTHPMVNIAIESARQAAWENNCVLMVLPTQGDRELRAAAIEILLGQRLAGVILSSFFTRQISVPTALRSQSKILLNCYAAAGNVPSLLPSHAAGAREAVRHLVGAGHRRIGFIKGEDWMEAYRDRQSGYVDALGEAGIKIDPVLMKMGDGSLSNAQTCTAELLGLGDPPTAIFCASDRMAMGCYEELKVRGVSIPGDVSVVGFDDDPTARYLSPPLSSVLVPHAEMGKRAVEHLIARRTGSSAGVVERRQYLDCPLIVRDSVRILDAGSAVERKLVGARKKGVSHEPL
ncbi:LacI family DNA-binding transcriptional regulator [Devosia algicola]|uniref:LacI family DNA-binding transcriptional regulator n=1 Tax=Devosia algicola TaxID=3026418 RepID=A0ABY7YJM6_9HYPH|nr:LacI family DNA-binding transcriptional regulator [Devosia algicola]WDR01499.1 LacI family DNA-binding transcriptional regulator [Devosia algicola]